MKEFKGTKGKWLIDNGRNIIIYNYEDRKVPDARNEMAVIPEILIGNNYHISRKEAEANAKLIAAAPELLESLRSCMDLVEGELIKFEHFSPKDELGEMYHDACKKAFALAEQAITKALGE